MIFQQKNHHFQQKNHHFQRKNHHFLLKNHHCNVKFTCEGLDDRNRTAVAHVVELPMDFLQRSRAHRVPQGPGDLLDATRAKLEPCV